jgi:hypothetical protein
MLIYETDDKGKVTKIHFYGMKKGDRTFIVPQMLDITDAITAQNVYDLIVAYEDNLWMKKRWNS